MSDGTKIQWTDATWNPTTGCSVIPGVKGGPSGCTNCYAKRLIDTRMSNNPKSVRFGHPFEYVMLHLDRLDEPMHWRKPRRIFVNSLSDLFHVDVPSEFVERVFHVMTKTATQHVYQILTKRPQRMKQFVRKWTAENGHLPPNVWLGTSISSNDDRARAEVLREIHAHVRFLSIEPLVAPVDQVDLEQLQWVIVGGESGPGWREMQFTWAQDILYRCRKLGIPFFFKQIAAFRPQEEKIPTRLRIRQYPVIA